MIPFDRYAHTNPAFAALCLHWVAEGYQEVAGGRADAPRLLSPVWGMLSLALLAPGRVRERLPRTATARLTNLLRENSTWRFALPEAMRIWTEPFWSGLRLGVATGILTLQEGRLQATGTLSLPSGETQLTLRKCAVVIGKILAKEGSDSAVGLAFGITLTR